MHVRTLWFALGATLVVACSGSAVRLGPRVDIGMDGSVSVVLTYDVTCDGGCLGDGGGPPLAELDARGGIRLVRGAARTLGPDQRRRVELLVGTLVAGPDELEYTHIGHGRFQGVYDGSSDHIRFRAITSGGSVAHDIRIRNAGDDHFWGPAPDKARRDAALAIRALLTG
jgi:hypothetical protein